MNPELIYDVGAHLGEDTDFYLKKGFRVVAVEANPGLIEKLKARFRSNLADGSLVLVEGAIAEDSGEVEFYVNQNLSVWGTIRPAWAERNAILGGQSKLIKVQGITFAKVLGKYGVPYYLKIDIEGADLLCLKSLIGAQDKPRFVSIESEKRSWNMLLQEFEIFRAIGYSRFKVVDQTLVQQQKTPNPAAEGHYAEHKFESVSSGLFGKELPEAWLTATQAIERYRAIFLRYRLFGDFGALRRLWRIPGFGRVFKPAPHYDTHATI